jgi:hypothetical protein
VWLAFGDEANHDHGQTRLPHTWQFEATGHSGLIGVEALSGLEKVEVSWKMPCNYSCF